MTKVNYFYNEQENFWVDSENNKNFVTDKVTKEQALKDLQSLRDCNNCNNCIDCDNCDGCYYCKNSNHLTNRTNHINCSEKNHKVIYIDNFDFVFVKPT